MQEMEKDKGSKWQGTVTRITGSLRADVMNVEEN